MGIDRWWQSIGVVASFLAFFTVAILISQFSVWGVGILETCGPGAAAAYFTFKYFEKKDKAVLLKLMNPEPTVWPVPLPVALGTIKDVLATSGVETRESGRQNWKMLREDQSRGLLQGQLDFAEAIAGTGGQYAMAPRSIGLTAIMSQDPAGTRVKFTYQVFSQMGNHQIKKVIYETNKEFPRIMEINKKEQGL